MLLYSSYDNTLSIYSTKHNIMQVYFVLQKEFFRQVYWSCILSSLSYPLLVIESNHKNALMRITRSSRSEEGHGDQ